MNRLFHLLVGLFILAAVLSPSALASDGELVPVRPASGELPPLYDQMPLWQYTVDQPSSASDNREALLRVNNLLIAKAWLLHTSIRTAEYAVSPPLLEPLIDPVAQAARGLSQSFQATPWIMAGLGLTGMAALVLRSVSGGQGRAYRLLLSALLVIGTQVWLIEYADAILRTGLTLPAAITDTGIQPIAQVAGNVSPSPQPLNGSPSQWLVRRAGEALWRSHVLQPWIQLEFGSEENANRYTQDGIPGGRLLARPPSTRLDLYYQNSVEDRQNLFRWWHEDYLVRRTVLAGGSLLLTGLVAIPLLALAGSLLFYQLLLLLCVALAPFVLTLALWWPAGAERIIRRLSMRMLGALVMPVILGLTLSVLLLLIVAGDRVGKDWTWTLVGLIHALLGIAAWRFRNDWLLLFRRHGEEPVSRSPLMQQNRLGTRDAWTAAPVIGSSAPNRAYREGHEPAPMGGHTPVRPDSHRDSRESEKMSDRPLSVRGENQLARFSEHVLRVREELQAGQRTVTWPRPADLPGPEPRVGVGASPSPASTPMPWSHSSQRRQSHESRP